MPNNMFSHPLGAHFSIAGGLENALYTAESLRCNAVQIFTKNARSWKETLLADEQVQKFKDVRAKTGISFVFSHCTYLINIASNDKEKLLKSRNSLSAEMQRSAILELDGVVLHPGAHLGSGIKKGLQTALESIEFVFSQQSLSFPKLLIETTAGSGTCLGSRFEEIATLVSAFPRHLGVCLDTSHIFAAGYDIRNADSLQNTIEQFDNIIGLKYLKVIHANDSKPDLGSKKDRHEHIGSGKIGKAGFKAIMTHPALRKIPKILETPKGDDPLVMDQKNLDFLRQLDN